MQKGPVGTYERWLEKQVEARRSAPEEEAATDSEPATTVTVEQEEELTATSA